MKITKLFMAIFLLATLPAQANESRICASQLQPEIEKIARSPKLQSARLGVFGQTSEPKPQILVNLDGDRYFIPSSNTKLFTTAIALKTLGADYRFATRLMSKSSPNAKGEIENGLWVFGSGDPSFNSITGLKSLVTQLKNKGVKRISGGLWGLTSRKGAEISGSWEWQDLQEDYAAIASPFTINENALNWTISPTKIDNSTIFKWEHPQEASDWSVENNSITTTAKSVLSKNKLPENNLKVFRPYGQKVLIISGQISENSIPELGSVAIPNPKANFLHLLRQELTIQGIEISSTMDISRRLPPNQAPNQALAIAYSPPLSELITTTNKDSNNLYAELLLRALGDRFHEITPDDNVRGGMIAVNKYLQSVNIATTDVLLADGSGLSRRNLATPRAIAQLLQTVASDRSINYDFRKSLAIAGVDGTLTNRFKNTSAQGLIQAKTGTLTGAIALSGYANPKKYSEVIFSIMINNSNMSAKETQQYVDAIAILFTRLESCS